MPTVIACLGAARFGTLLDAAEWAAMRAAGSAANPAAARAELAAGVLGNEVPAFSSCVLFLVQATLTEDGGRSTTEVHPRRQ